MSEKERRDAVRVSKTLEATYSSEGPSLRARIDDLSEHGMFLDTENMLSIGQEIDFSFHFAELDALVPIQGKGVVVRAEPQVGVGIRFTEISDEDRERLRFYVGAVYFGHISRDRKQSD